MRFISRTATDQRTGAQAEQLPFHILMVTGSPASQCLVREFIISKKTTKQQREEKLVYLAVIDGLCVVHRRPSHDSRA